MNWSEVGAPPGTDARPGLHRATPGDAFHRLTVAAVTRPTADAVALVLSVPAALREKFHYEAGQFVTIRTRIGGRIRRRCYSMSSAPAVDPELTVMVKRVPGGPVSTWLTESVGPGDQLEVSGPAGSFLLSPDRPVVAYAGGSGITPLLSIVKTALSTTDRQVKLLYANRDRESVIFRSELDHLAERYVGRFELVHHIDAEKGTLDPTAVRRSAGRAAAGAHEPGEADEADVYLCGPAGFMTLVEQTLTSDGVDPARIRSERFEVPTGDPEPSPDTRITFVLGGKTTRAEHRSGNSLLQAARAAGLRAPSSCEIGGCATCMARVTEGAAVMRNNTVLTAEEIEEGWVLTCQAWPASPELRVVYE